MIFFGIAEWTKWLKIKPLATPNKRRICACALLQLLLQLFYLNISRAKRIGRVAIDVYPSIGEVVVDPVSSSWDV
jgi:hypothetical protein